MIIQPKGMKRIPASTRLTLEIKNKLQYLSDQTDCSKSFIIASHMADALGITKDNQVRYYDIIKKRLAKKRIAKARTRSKDSTNK